MLSLVSQIELSRLLRLENSPRASSALTEKVLARPSVFR